MRKIPSDIAKKLNYTIQTKANSANISTNLWISRPNTALTDDIFLERQTVLDGNITDVSIAVCHPRFGSYNTKTDIAYISDGVAHVVTAANKTRMIDHIWVDTGFSEEATAISIAYDGTMPKNTLGQVEFLTESKPWIFWVNGGVLYAKKLGSEKPVVLAEQNCTDVSAVRAMGSNVGGFDFGLVVFSILAGKIYYRQLIDGEWKDAEAVDFGPSDVTWSEIAASRTWDYRVILQAKTTTGEVYEMFTQFMGIGRQNVQHFELNHVSVSGLMTAVKYHDASTNEHVKLSDVTVGALYGGLYSTNIPQLINAYNVPTTVTSSEGETYEDWGMKLIVQFDIHINSESVEANNGAFVIEDQNGITYSSSAATLESDGKTVTLIFPDFNAAFGKCKAKYVPGTVITMAGNSLEETSYEFTPENLVPPLVDPPEVVEVINI